MHLTIATEREDDCRWIAEVPELQGCLAYRDTLDSARQAATALALRTIAPQAAHSLLPLPPPPP